MGDPVRCFAAVSLKCEGVRVGCVAQAIEDLILLAGWVAASALVGLFRSDAPVSSARVSQRLGDLAAGALMGHKSNLSRSLEDSPV